MIVADAIRTELTATFAPERLEIVDESHLHAGHMGHRPGVSTHFRVAIVAGAFAGKSRVERQRMIYAALDALMGKPIHALSLSELTYDDTGAAFRESLKALKLRRIVDEIQEIKTAQAAAERAGHTETVRTLLIRQNALQQERQRLLGAGPLPLTEVGSVNA